MLCVSVDLKFGFGKVWVGTFLILTGALPAIFLKQMLHTFFQFKQLNIHPTFVETCAVSDKSLD